MSEAISKLSFEPSPSSNVSPCGGFSPPLSVFLSQLTVAKAERSIHATAAILMFFFIFFCSIKKLVFSLLSVLSNIVHSFTETVSDTL